MLPNLLIIGAAKSGTTSLHDYLDCHPEVYMARPNGAPAGGERIANDALPKEMRFWWRDDWRERLPWYEAHFEVGEPVRGEATPAYSAHPYHAGVPERIRSLVPDVKLVYLVRDPIDRIVSHWVQQRVDGDRRPLATRLGAPGFEDDSIVCPSRYAMQIERYLKLFAAERILIIDQHDLRHRRRETLRELFGFLGVDRDYWSPRFEREQNTREDKYALTRTGEPLFHRLDRLGRRATPDLWDRARPAARRALSRRVTERPAIEPELRARLESLLAPEVARLRAISGRDFASWSL
jgi:hypothetical protein